MMELSSRPGRTVLERSIFQYRVDAKKSFTVVKRKFVERTVELRRSFTHVAGNQRAV